MFLENLDLLSETEVTADPDAAATRLKYAVDRGLGGFELERYFNQYPVLRDKEDVILSKDVIDLVLKDLEFHEEDMEPTDSQGYTYDVPCKYKGLSVTAHVSIHGPDKSWNRAVARDVLAQIRV